MTWYDPRTWVQRITRPIYQRVYRPYVSPHVQRVRTGISTMQTTAQRYARKYKPTVSYERAAERRERVVRKLKKIKKRIPEKEAIARTIVRASPGGIIAREAIKRVPDIKRGIKEIKEIRAVERPPVPTTQRRVKGYGQDFAIAESIPRGALPKHVSVSGAPGQMGLLMGAKATLPFWRQKVEEAWGWKPQAERKFETQLKEYQTATTGYKRTPEGALILPTKLTPEVQTWKSQKEALETEAERKGWVTGSKIMYPATPEGEAWAERYETVIKRGEEKYLTPEGRVKPEYVEYTDKSKAILAQQEALTKRTEQLSNPVYMAKEHTKGMWIAPVVTKAYEFGDWWGKTVSTPLEEATKKYPQVATALSITPMPIITVPRYIGKKVLEQIAPKSVKEYIRKMPLGITDLPTSVKVGMVKGVPDIPIMAAEVGYAGEYIYEHPKEAAMIAPGVAAYITKGMAKEAVTSPGEFAGRMITMAVVTGGIGKAVRPVMPKHISGIRPTETGAITYKGLGIRGIKEPRPVIGMWKETTRTPDIVGIQRALVLGKQYPAVRYLKGVREAEIPMPEFGVGARVFGKQTYTEVGIGRAIKYERMRMEGLWGKDYFLPERTVGVPEPAKIPTFKALPPPKPVLWKRVGPPTLAKRVTALAKTKQPKPIREWGIRIEKPDIPTYTELAHGRAYKIEKGYRAFQIGEYPTIFKTLGLGKGIPKFGKGITEIIHPFRKKVPRAYEPSMLDYQAPRGLLTEGLRLDMTMAKIRPSERPPSPIEKLYERVTAEDIFRDLGIERRPAVGVSAVLKPIETRYLKFTPEGELISQPEATLLKPKRKAEVTTTPKVSFDFKVMPDKAIKTATDTGLSTKTIVKETTKETRRVREAAKEEIGKIEAFGKMPISKGFGFGFPVIKGIPTYISERVEKEKSFGIVIPGYEVAFKPHPIEAFAPKEKRKEKEGVFGLIKPKIQPSVDLGFETAPRVEPITDFEYEPIRPPPPVITTFGGEEPPPFIPFSWGDGKKKKKRKPKAKKQWEWLEEFTVQRPAELHFGAIESGIPKVSKVVMLPQITMADITPKPRKTKTLKGIKTNKRVKKKK